MEFVLANDIRISIILILSCEIMDWHIVYRSQYKEWFIHSKYCICVLKKDYSEYKVEKLVPFEFEKREYFWVLTDYVNPELKLIKFKENKNETGNTVESEMSQG